MMETAGMILSGDDKAFDCEVFSLNVHSCRYSCLCSKSCTDSH